MTKPDFSLKDRIAVVTGAKRGIGKEIALTFAEAGADVAVCSRVVEDGQLEAVAKEIQGLGRRSIAVQVDVSVKADVDRMVQQVIDEFGRIDVLVSNAAVNIKYPVLEFPEEEYDKEMNINLKGCFLCCQAVGRRMKEAGKGVIVTVTSEFGLQQVNTMPGMSVYSMSKAGIVMLTTSLAKELGPYGIRVNAIAPTSTRTHMSTVWENPEVEERIAKTIPLGRVAEPSDQAAAVLFLASEAAGYINGVTLRVDGGKLG